MSIRLGMNEKPLEKMAVTQYSERDVTPGRFNNQAVTDGLLYGSFIGVSCNVYICTIYRAMRNGTSSHVVTPNK